MRGLAVNAGSINYIANSLGEVKIRACLIESKQFATPGTSRIEAGPCLGARAITDAETLMWMWWGLSKGAHRRAGVDRVIGAGTIFGEFSTLFAAKLSSFDLAAQWNRSLSGYSSRFSPRLPCSHLSTLTILRKMTAYSQSKMLKESSVKISTHRAQQGLVVDSPTLLDSNKSARVPSSSVRMSSPILLPLGACILRC
jgi:hypothetical protein